jgi:hypothetical protein
MSDLSKNSNIARIPATLDADFFFKWLSFLYPLHRLSNNEKHVLSMLLYKRFKLLELVKDQAIINSLLLSNDSRIEMKNGLNMSSSQFNIIIAKLKKSGIITSSGLNKKYIPNLEFDSTQHRLILIFDFNNVNKEGTDV